MGWHVVRLSMMEFDTWHRVGAHRERHCAQLVERLVLVSAIGVNVDVRDDGDAPVSCSEYTLVLDSVATAAFEMQGCDPLTGASSILLLHRAALFDEHDVAPRPLAAGISAVQVRTGGERGGARRTGASEVQCTAAVRPYLEDLEHGRRVYLLPGRFALRPLAAGITAEASHDGWLLRSREHASVTAEYQVLDTQTGEVVVHTRTTLACSAAESNSAYQVASAPARAQPTMNPSCGGFPALSLATAIGGSTSAGRVHPVYALRVDRPLNVIVDVTGDFEGEVDLYAGCSSLSAREAVFRIAEIPDLGQSVTLAPGWYTLAVEDHDQRPHRGTYSLRVRPVAHDPESHLH